jgi:predicted phage tail protein
MKTVVLHGELAERFGAEWKLDVRSPAEALRAINANRPGLLAHLAQSHERGVAYQVLLDKEAVSEGRLADPFGREVLHIVPVISGAKTGAGQIIAGIALIVASYYIPGASSVLFSAGGTAITAGGIMVNIGIGLIINGTAQMIMGAPKPPQAGDPQSELPGYFFSGPQNVSGEDSPIPVGYGRALVGSVVASASITSNSVQVY